MPSISGRANNTARGCKNLRFYSPVRFLFMYILCPRLFKEAEAADYCRLFGFARAELEEADNSENKKYTTHNAVCNRNDYRPEKKRYAYKHENVDNREFECLSDMEHGERRLAACQKRDDYAYRAEKITEHGKNLVVGNIPRVELCGVVVGVALRRNGGVLGILRLCLSGFGNARAAVGAKCGSVVKLYVAIRTCFHNIVSLVLYNSHCPTKRLCRAMFFIISLQTIT